MIKVDGRKISERIVTELKQKPRPGKKLVAVWVGDDPASESFLKQKEKIARELRVSFELIQLAEVISQDELEEKIRELANDETVGGIIVQLPLPKNFNRDAMLAQLRPAKDVDNLTGQAAVESPAVAVVKEILQNIGWLNVNGQMSNVKVVAVVGAEGFLVGKPIVNWLNFQFSMLNFQLRKADIDTPDLASLLKDADLVITAVGKEGLIKPEWLKPGAGVIDFGFPADLADEADKLTKLAFYTPTPGGTGPILVAKLFENFYRLCAVDK